MENIALLPNTRAYGFVGVNMYVDDEGSIKSLPRNVRASEVAHCCGRPIEVRRSATPCSLLLHEGQLPPDPGTHAAA